MHFRAYTKISEIPPFKSDNAFFIPKKEIIKNENKIIFSPLFTAVLREWKILFSVEFRRVHLVIPAKAGIHFYRQIPHSPLFAKKMCGDSKLNFRGKFAENSKINRPE